jgi:hypothetical protein
MDMMENLLPVYFENAKTGSLRVHPGTWLPPMEAVRRDLHRAQLTRPEERDRELNPIPARVYRHALQELARWGEILHAMQGVDADLYKRAERMTRLYQLIIDKYEAFELQKEKTDDE